MNEREELNRRASILETERRMEMGVYIAEDAHTRISPEARRELAQMAIDGDLQSQLKKVEDSLNELLELLKQRLSRVETRESMFTTPQQRAEIKALRAAIAKAEKKEDSSNG